MERQGFTLIEIVIVVTVIAILAVIAVPNLLRSRMQSNEAAAIENMRTISSAEVMYRNSKKNYGDFAALCNGSSGPPCLDPSWSEGCTRQGYVFSLATVTADEYVCFADPQASGTTGNRFFRCDASGIIRWKPSVRPSASDPAI